MDDELERLQIGGKSDSEVHRSDSQRTVVERDWGGRSHLYHQRFEAQKTAVYNQGRNHYHHRPKSEAQGTVVYDQGGGAAVAVRGWYARLCPDYRASEAQ